MEKIKKKHAQKIRYTLVGGFNTALDFCLLFVFVALGIDRIPANYLSTGISMIVSFFANKRFTFRHTTGSKRRQIPLFIIVTVFGMWVVQPVVIWLATLVLDPYIAQKSVELFIAKSIATGASLVSNYLFYSRVVFKKHNTEPVEEK